MFRVEATTMPRLRTWLSRLSALLGVWVFVSVAYFQLSTAEFWNNVAIGGVIVVLAGYSASRNAARLGRISLSVLASLLGLWLIASPSVFELAGIAAWSSMLSGAAIAVLSGATAYLVLTESGEESVHRTGTFDRGEA